MLDALAPADQLARLAFDRLVEGGLLRTERHANIVAKLASGKMSQEDWGLELELAAPKVDL